MSPSRGGRLPQPPPPPPLPPNLSVRRTRRLADALSYQIEQLNLHILVLNQYKEELDRLLRRRMYHHPFANQPDQQREHLVEFDSVSSIFCYIEINLLVKVYLLKYYFIIKCLYDMNANL